MTRYALAIASHFIARSADRRPSTITIYRNINTDPAARAALAAALRNPSI